MAKTSLSLSNLNTLLQWFQSWPALCDEVPPCRTQALNKLSGQFTPADENLLQLFGVHLGNTLTKSRYYEEAKCVCSLPTDQQSHVATCNTLYVTKAQLQCRLPGTIYQAGGRHAVAPPICLALHQAHSTLPLVHDVFH